MSTTIRNRRNRYATNLKSKEYRDVLVSESISSRLAMQIRMMRKSRGLTQEQLGASIGTKQEAVSRLENPDYGRYSLDTLLKLASTFDVALRVTFISFGELLDQLTFRRSQDLDVPSYEDDQGILVQSSESPTVSNVVQMRPPQAAGYKWSLTGSGVENG